MTNEQYNASLMKALKQHEELLNKELSYSEDLQNTAQIQRHKNNIAKVKGMFK